PSLCLLLEPRIQYGELLVVGVHKQFGQELRLVGSVVRQKVRCEGSFGGSFRSVISTDVGQRGKERVLHGPIRFAPLTQEEWVFHNEVIDNERAALSPPLAFRIILRQRRCRS